MRNLKDVIDNYERVNKGMDSIANSAVTKTTIFGKTYIKLDNNLRIKFGYNKKYYGVGYTLQLKRLFFYKDLSFIYSKIVKEEELSLYMVIRTLLNFYKADDNTNLLF